MAESACAGASCELVLRACSGATPGWSARSSTVSVIRRECPRSRRRTALVSSSTAGAERRALRHRSFDARPAV